MGPPTSSATNRVRHCRLFQRTNIHSNRHDEHRLVNLLLLLSSTYIHLAVTISTDFLLALLPVPFVWQLQLNGRTKITLVCILALGLFAGVAAIIKSEKQKTALIDPDPYIDDTFTMWRFIEYDVGIIVASLPSLKPLFKHILHNGTRGTTVSSGHQIVNKVRCSMRNKVADDDEVPLENYKGVGNSVEVSSGLPKTPVDGKGSEESVRPFGSNAIFVDTKWRVS